MAKARKKTRTEEIIKANTDSAEKQYEAELEQIMADIKSLNSTVDKAVNDELDRLISDDEKKRIMQKSIGSQNEGDPNYDQTKIDQFEKKLRALKPNDFLSAIGRSAESFVKEDSEANAIAKNIHISSFDKPAAISQEVWDGYDVSTKKLKIIKELRDNKDPRLAEVVFKGLSDEEKRKLIAADPQAYFDILTDDEKLLYIAQYQARENSEEGNDKSFDDKLEKSKKRKDQLKKSVKERAENLINELQKVIDKNAEEIVKLQEKIAEKEKSRLDLETQPLDYSRYAALYTAKGAKVPDLSELQKIAQADRKEAVEKLGTEIENLKDDLGKAQGAQVTAQKNLNQLKKNLELILAGKNIYVGSQAINENTNQNPSPEIPDNASTVMDNTYVDDSSLSQKDKAKNMIDSFKGNADTADFRNLLHQKEYKDLVGMTKLIRGGRRKDLRTMISITRDDMTNADTSAGIYQDLVDMLAARTSGITMDNLSDLATMKPEQLKEIYSLVTDLDKQYSSQSPRDIEVIDRLMDYVKLGMLERESVSFKGFKNAFKSREEKTYLRMLTSALEKHSEHQFDHKKSIAMRYNDFRKSLHIGEIDISKLISSVDIDKVADRTKNNDHEL